MGSLNTTEQRKLAYFHALGKVMTEGNQEVYESRYKSSHNVKLGEVWASPIASAVTYSAAVAEAASNSAVTLYTQVTLTELPGSNGQLYYYNSGGTFIRPWISPVDVPNTTTNLPSDGYQVRLFRGAGTEIFLTEGAWSVDYYAGMIHFGVGYTPTNLGWGAIKATFFQYTGTFGASGGTSVGAFTTAVFDSGTSYLTFNSGLSSQTIVDLSALAGDSSISTALSTEVSDRISADSSLSSILSTSNSGITSLSVALSTVISGNTYDDSSLSTAISTEVLNRSSKDESLSTSILNVITGVTSTDNSLSTSISTEESRRVSADASLTFAINNISGFTTADFDSGSSTLYFNSGMSSQDEVDLSSLKAVSGTTSKISKDNSNMSAFTTNSGSTHEIACLTPLSNNILNSKVCVFVNGVQVSVGSLSTDCCFFSPDGGATRRNAGSEIMGDFLYWNYNAGHPVAGYELSATVDKISFLNLQV